MALTQRLELRQGQALVIGGEDWPTLRGGFERLAAAQHAVEHAQRGDARGEAFGRAARIVAWTILARTILGWTWHRRL